MRASFRRGAERAGAGPKGGWERLMILRKPLHSAGRETAEDSDGLSMVGYERYR